MKSLLEAEEESMQEVREHDVVKATVVENKGDVETVAKNVIAACRNLR